MTKTIEDVTGHINTVEDLLTDTTLSNDVRTQLEALQALLKDVKTEFESLLQEIQNSKNKRAIGIYLLLYRTGVQSSCFRMDFKGSLTCF